MALDAFISNISATQVKSLSNTTIGQLVSEDAVTALGKHGASLSSGQVGALNQSVVNTFDFTYVSSKSAAGLTATQIDALTSMTNLNSEVVKGLSAAAVGSLSTAQLTTLGTDADDTDDVPALLASLSAKQVQSLDVTQLDAPVLLSLNADQVKGLSTTQMGQLTGAQLAGIDDDLGALTSTQLKALSNNTIASLGNDALASLDTAALKGLEADDFLALTDVQLDALFGLNTLTDTSSDEEVKAVQDRVQSVNAEWVTAAYLETSRAGTGA
ncbi:hypothetical protein SAMN03159496_01866 [Rhizobium sp. NFR07]|uniref:hypothetical protein n=1 Tax=Rhizobium sp. NFR07 TaxID=1566262 RepID=UPI0008E34675|nr:hypothetical protein [Rhizobium sp. NFR07]SFB10132.1 hypothetical protein SAMN03159496_01866 [Rhizobium sp. NFR07]